MNEAHAGNVPKPYYEKFYHKSTVEEFKIIDDYENKLVQCYIHNIQRTPDEGVDYPDDESYISISKMEDKCSSEKMGISYLQELSSTTGSIVIAGRR